MSSTRIPGSTSATVSRRRSCCAISPGSAPAAHPIIAQLLADIRRATGSEGKVRDLTDPLFQEYTFQVPTTSLSRYPTVRLDYQITNNHRMTYAMNYHYSRG